MAFLGLYRKWGRFNAFSPLTQNLFLRKLAACALLALLSFPVAFAQLEMLNTEEEVRKSDSENLPEPTSKPVSKPASNPENGPAAKPAKMPGKPTTRTAALTVKKKMPLASNSMLGHILLAMAYERDSLLGEWIKKRKRTEPAAALGLIGAYGVTLAQGINESLHVSGAADTPQERSFVVPSLTIVQAGLGLVTFIGTSIWAHHCNRHIQARQQELQRRVDVVLQRLDRGENDQAVSSELNSLVGEDAKDEYLKLWHVIHPSTIAPTAPSAGLQNGQPKSAAPTS